VIDKVMPYSLDAERAVLGSILLDERYFYIANAGIEANEFYMECHRVIFRAMNQTKASGIAIDLVTLAEELRRAGELEQSGGIAYLSELTSGLPRTVNVEYYARIVREKSKLREGIRIGNELMGKCYADELPADEIIEEYQSQIRKLVSTTEKGFHTGASAVNDTYNLIQNRYENKRTMTGIGSGLSDLDRLTTGFQRGDLIIIAAKTGLGKTALALNIASNTMIRERSKVLIFSLEMTREQLGTRMISSETGIDSYALRTGYIAADKWTVIAGIAAEISQCNFWIHDKSISLAELDSRARQTVDENGKLDLVIVDYLQLVHGSKRAENRTQEVTEISRGLKAIATDLDVPVIALSQLNSEGEVRESRAIEQDASLVLIIEMDKDSLRKNDLVEAVININKNRNGPLGSINVQYRKAVTRFEQGTSTEGK